jgi:hypothetical protein
MRSLKNTPFYPKHVVILGFHERLSTNGKGQTPYEILREKLR